MRSIHSIVLAAILLVTACGQPADLPLSAPASEAPSATPPPPTPTVDPENVPIATPPGGLGTITLPNDDATLRGIFTALPETIGDYQLFDTHTGDPDYFMTTYRLPNADPADMRARLMLGARSDIDQGPRFPGRIIAPYADY